MIDKDIKEKLHYRNFIKSINSLYLSSAPEKLMPLIEQQFTHLWERAKVHMSKYNQQDYLFVFDEIRFNKRENFQLNILVLVLYDKKADLSLPVDARIYFESEGKNKHFYLREMLQDSYDRGFSPKLITASVWYSSLENLKLMRTLGLYWVIFLKPNRRINLTQVLSNLEFLPEQAVKAHLKGYGWISIFKTINQRGEIEYVGTNLLTPTMEDIDECLHARNSNLLCHRVRRHGVAFRSPFREPTQRYGQLLEMATEKE